MTAVKDFSIEEKLVGLLKLQSIDSKLDKIKIIKGELPIEVTELEDEIAGLTVRLTKVEEEINGISDFIEQKRELIKEALLQVKKYEKQSDNVKNNREFEAINKEIEMQNLETKLAEKHIKDAGEEITIKGRVLEQAKKNIANKTIILETKKAELSKIIADTEKEENQLVKASSKAREALDEKILFSYDRIRNNYRNGLAVVAVLRDSCGGCYSAIPPQKQSDIKQNKKIIVCENCGRILVDEPAISDKK